MKYAVVKYPGKPARIENVVLVNAMHKLCRVVGCKMLEVLSMGDFAIWFDEEGLLKDRPVTNLLFDSTDIIGTVVLLGVDYEKESLQEPLTKEEAEEARKLLDLVAVESRYPAKYLTNAPQRYDYGITHTLEYIEVGGEVLRIVVTSDAARFRDYQLPRYSSGLYYCRPFNDVTRMEVV